MSILVGTNVSKSFGAFDLFSNLNFSVAHGDKIALVGANGCGKTTLLTIIGGSQEANIGGGVTFARGITRGFLAQAAEESNENTVWQEMQSAFTDLNALAHQLQQLEHEMADLAQPDKAEKALERYGPLQHDFEMKGGYNVDARIKRVLSGLSFKESQMHRPLSKLSGGQRVRAALARLLLQSPDVLLLDEPTNHLDTQGIEWLESYLQEWEGTLMIVSHDRYFLDEVCEQVWEMGRHGDGLSYLESYRGGYTDYVAQRTARRERALKEFDAQQEKIAKEAEYIRRNMAGQNTSIAKGKLKRLNRLERLEKPLEQRAMSLRLNSGPRSGNIVLETTNVEIGYRGGERKETTDDGRRTTAEDLPSSIVHRPPSPLPLFTVPNLQLLRTERAALIGPNGTGKTTFLKTILEEVAPLKGEVRLGASLRVGYFAQAYEGLDASRTVLAELMSARDDLKLSEARNMLGRFLFSGDDAFKKVGMLSGGERGRVALAKLTLQGANFLLLDEPTNHLDIPAQEVLTDALNQFDGTLLLVSHDRYLVAALATQIWSLERAEIVDGSGDEAARGPTTMSVFRGSYDAWIEEKIKIAENRDALGRKQDSKAKPQESKVKSQDSSVKSQAAASPLQPEPLPGSSRANKNQEQRRVKKLEETEQRITTLERRLAEVSWEMEVAANDYPKLKALGDEYQKVEAELAAAWVELEKVA